MKYVQLWSVTILVTLWIVDAAPKSQNDVRRDIPERNGILRHPRTKPEEHLTTPLPLNATQPPAPTCFQAHEHSSLWEGFLTPNSFRQTKNNVSPETCSQTCTKIHDDQDEVRTCRAFDFNSRTGVCRFFERNTQDEKVRKTDNSKTVLYELNEPCWTKLRSTPKLPPHESACKEGSKPLMERVSGYYLKASGLIFKQVEQKECVKQCLNDQTPSRLENYKCQSVSYNDENQVCAYLSQIARPLNKNGPPLTSDSRYTYYSKLCLSLDAVAKCPGYITRFVGKQLVAMSDAKTTTPDYSGCVRACLTAEAKLGFLCRSGMFYNKLTTDNCILNYSDHYEEHTLFLDGEAQEIDYFSLKSCEW